ncbi:MAG: hypothetical protein P8I91_03700 [Phycisphaerales bacterium]|jgi:hypothetical protein|nr:hypothetical protein [Phycisphaerales bacterium]
MQRVQFYLVSLIASTSIATPTLAGSLDVSLTLNNETVDLTAGTIPGLFGDGGSLITEEELFAVNESLIAADIQTVGHLSILLAETDRGLALINLFGGNDGSAPGQPPISVLGCQLFWEGHDTTMVNQDSGGTWTVSPAGDDWLVGAGSFQWQQGLSFEAMALTELNLGQNASFHFNDLGMHNMQEQVLQLITFGDSGSWEVADTAAFTNGAIEIDAEITNAVPAPGSLVVLALAGFAGPRRRRR